jgi:hypothetical protein
VTGGTAHKNYYIIIINVVIPKKIILNPFKSIK